MVREDRQRERGREQESVEMEREQVCSYRKRRVRLIAASVSPYTYHTNGDYCLIRCTTGSRWGGKSDTPNTGDVK